MLTYTFEDMDATKYAKSTVNVRSLPTADGEKLGGLSTNDEVKVTGKCNETGWYRIEYSDGVAYVSDSYLVDNKVETKPAEAPASNNDGNNSSASSSGAFPYDLYVVYGSGADVYIYTPWGEIDEPSMNTLVDVYRQNTGYSGLIGVSWVSVGEYDGVLYVKRYCEQKG